MKYPPDWVVTPGTAKLADAYDNFDYPYVYVSRDTVSGTVSLSLSVSASISYYKSHNKAKLISTSKVRLAGWGGKLLTFDGVDDGLKVRIQVIILAKGSVGYYIWMFTERTTAAQDKALFKRMYTSWRPR
ncbi:MAG: hypothetical protein H0V73_11755 [Chloroflexi bacterium]|nr:hypothetical protein [Chloroflexota bacterium]